MNGVPFNLNRHILSGKTTKKQAVTCRLDAVVLAEEIMSFQETNLYLLKHAGAPFTTDRLFFVNLGPKK